MSKKAVRYIDLPKYRYYISNPVTLMELSRDFHAKNNAAAWKRVRQIQTCFGRSTEIDKLVRLVKKQRDLFDDDD